MFGNAVVNKSDLTDDQKEAIRASLTLPNPDYDSKAKFSRFGVGKTPQFIEYFVEYRDEFLIPRSTLKLLGIDVPFVTRVTEGKNVNFTLTRELRDYQEEFYNPLDKSVTDNIFEAGCGTGKTFLSIKYISDIGKKPLVFVPTNYLAEQWKTRFLEFTDLISLDIIILNNNHTIEDIYKSKVLIITLDMFNVLKILKGRDSENFFNEIGVVVFDEGHRLGAESYHPIVSKFTCRYRLLLTATFRRPDGREKLLEHHFGKISKMKDPLPIAQTYFLDTGMSFRHLIAKKDLSNPANVITFFGGKCIEYKDTLNYIAYNLPEIKKTSWSKLGVKTNIDFPESIFTKSDIQVLKTSQEKIHQAQLDNFVVEYSPRVKMFISLIQKCLAEGRVPLVLSKRKEILKKLHNHFCKSYKSALVISETNKISDAQRDDIQKNAEIIFGIMQLAQEGLDIDRIDTLILIHPIIDTEQGIGRTRRVLEGKKQSLIFYPKDNVYSYKSIQHKAVPFIELNSEIKGTVNIKDVANVL